MTLRVKLRPHTTETLMSNKLRSKTSLPAFPIPRCLDQILAKTLEQRRSVASRQQKLKLLEANLNRETNIKQTCLITVHFAICHRSSNNACGRQATQHCLGCKDVGFNGCTDIKTPNLDALAAGGEKFTSSTSSRCARRTRAALMTGRYPFRYGLQTMGTAGYALYTSEWLMPQCPKEAATTLPSSANGISATPT